MTLPNLITEVKRLEIGRAQDIYCEKDILNLVESPLVEACLELFRKNIETMSSSANGEYTTDGAYIDINYDNLSSYNKAIVDQFIHLNQAELIEPYQLGRDTRARIYIMRQFDISENGLPEKIQNISLNIVSKFKQQKLLFGVYDMKWIRANAPDVFDIEEPQEIADALGYIYSTKTQCFYLNDLYMEKHINSLHLE